MEKEIIKTRVSKMIKLMKKDKIDFYIVPNSDPHLNENIVPHFQNCKDFSGFSGSNCTMLYIWEAQGAMLWTDGRYKIQASHQLVDTGIQLNCSSDQDTPTVYEFLAKHMKTSTSIGVDCSLISAREGKKLEGLIQRKKQAFVDIDLSSKMYDKKHPRPELKFNPLFTLEDTKSANDKIEEVYQEIEKKGATCTYISTLDEIAWILNLRGSDIDYSPLFFSYLFIAKKERVLFTSAELSKEVKDYLHSIKVTVLKYDDLAKDIKRLGNKEVIFLDPDRTNYRLFKSIKKPGIVTGVNPSYIAKSIKSDFEVNNLRRAHKVDGVAFVKTIKHIKDGILAHDSTLRETEVTNLLRKYRQECPDYICDSFATIAAYKDHAAMMHYCASEDTDFPLEGEGMLLIDSGAHYRYGTTDTTRTIVLGPLSNEQKRDYTLVLKGLISLSSLHFLKGCSGENLDVLARIPLWNYNYDYKCGTGHGIGYVLTVHEGPNRIRWNNDVKCPLELNMYTSIEPGVYKENQYGIRLENNCVVVKDTTNDSGEFYKFFTLTMVPLDTEAIDPTYLSSQEIQFINDYNQQVCEALSPLLSVEEVAWLTEYTKPIE